MATRLYLIRHGQTTWNAERRWQGAMDPPLSDAGRLQAAHVATALRPVPLQAVYCSPLQRARDTAAAVAASHQLSAESVDDLREIAFGEWESLVHDEVEERFGALLSEWWKRPDQVQIPGGEALETGRRRAVGAVQRIAARHPDAGVAVVAHGGVNKLIMLTLLGAPLASFWRIKQDNACINVLEFDGDHGRVLMMNDTTHLL